VSELIIGGLDLETTGLKQEDGHRIIEIAISIYRYNPETHVRANVLRWEQRINPGRSIDPAAQAVHKIPFEALVGMPVWPEVAPRVAKLMAKCDFLVAHNGDGFDLPFIAMELLRVGVAVPDVLSVDTMTAGRWATPLGKSPSLRELAFACDVPYDPEKAHAALYDVDVTMECFFLGLEQGFFQIPKRKSMEAA
jgi:DNA polymerase-3 subunit epsilon